MIYYKYILFIINKINIKSNVIIVFLYFLLFSLWYLSDLLLITCQFSLSRLYLGIFTILVYLMSSSSSLSRSEQLYEKAKSALNKNSYSTAKDLVQELQADFSFLSFDDWKLFHTQLSELIANDTLSDIERERFVKLQQELAWHYPPKLEHTPENE